MEQPIGATHVGVAMPPGVKTNERGHITVCVCTYKRPELLLRLLAVLTTQETGGRFTYSVVVADSDHLESARAVVADCAAAAPIAIRYCVEPRRNIALARNKAVEHASGDFVALIDDDEEPTSDWLIRLLTALELYGADGVLGPVIPRFSTPPPDWIVRGRIHERPSLPTGTWLRWKQTRTANVLVRRGIFDEQGNRFRVEYGRGGEDLDFFRRTMAMGRRFVWCAEAGVYEVVPAERCRRAYLLKAALLRGRAPYNQEPWPVLTSLFAIPTYAVALPVLLAFGQHVFMRYLIKECDHLGRIVALLSGQRGTGRV
jgi:glycosyltransferase involved in cell wall biosynthesis